MLTSLTVVEDSNSAAGTIAIFWCGSSGGSVQWWRWGRTGGGSARSGAGRTPARGRIPWRWQHTSRWRLAHHVYFLLLVLFILRWRLVRPVITATVRPRVGLPLLGHEAPWHFTDVSVSLFITPLVFVVFSLTSVALCCSPQRLSNGRGGGGDDDGRTRALLNVVIEMLKGLLMPSSGE